MKRGSIITIFDYILFTFICLLMYSYISSFIPAFNMVIISLLFFRTFVPRIKCKDVSFLLLFLLFQCDYLNSIQGVQ